MSFFSLLIYHESFSTPIKAILIPKSPTVLGFIAYFVSTSSLYFSPLIRSQYAARNPVSPEPTVRANDVAFAAHAVLLSFFTWTMFWKWAWGFEQGGSGRVPRVILGIAAGCMIGVLWVMGLVWTKGRDAGRDPTSWAWIDVVCTSILDNPSNKLTTPPNPQVYATGYVKLIITLIKFLPQIYTNHLRQSTAGWSIEQVLLDLVGGILSIAQLLIDSSLQNDWSGLTGNPVKFALGNISFVVDAVFMLQHYVLYRGKDGKGEEEEAEAERRWLLAGGGGEVGVRV